MSSANLDPAGAGEERPGRRWPRSTAASFERIEQVRAHEYVAEQIRRQITLRLVASGEPLPAERDLASMFGVGRATVQAAIRLLEADRLVETRRGRRGGTFVTAMESDGIAISRHPNDPRMRTRTRPSWPRTPSSTSRSRDVRQLGRLA